MDLIERKDKKMKTLTIAMLIAALVATADCKKQDDPANEKTPPHITLHIAALQGNVDVVKQHIKAGSNLDAKDEYGSTPLIIAITFGKTQVASLLIAAGADIEITNNEKATPLHIAAFFCRTSIVQDLLNNNAEKTALNSSGATALQTAELPFEHVKPAYDRIAKALKPLGLRLDYKRIKKIRPMIAEMLR